MPLKRPDRICLFIILISLSFLNSCKVSYSFTGANISPQVKTMSIQTFQNRASLVQPGLTNYITNALIDKCKSQTKLNLIKGVGDVNFEGEITEYNSKPLTVGGDSRAAMNRFTITIKVKFTNSVEPDLSYEKSFTRYDDYNSSLDISAVESTMVDAIVILLVEDVFNEAFVKW
jgi:Lipopolysaccharide-assembly